VSTKLGTVYNVTRSTATKNQNIGDYQTIEEATAAMIEHYKNTPKRGNISYRVSQETLEDIGGVVMRYFTMCLSGKGEQSYYKKYGRPELDNLINKGEML